MNQRREARARASSRGHSRANHRTLRVGEERSKYLQMAPELREEMTASLTGNRFEDAPVSYPEAAHRRCQRRRSPCKRAESRRPELEPGTPSLRASGEPWSGTVSRSVERTRMGIYGQPSAGRPAHRPAHYPDRHGGGLPANHSSRRVKRLRQVPERSWSPERGSVCSARSILQELPTTAPRSRDSGEVAVRPGPATQLAVALIEFGDVAWFSAVTAYDWVPVIAE